MSDDLTKILDKEGVSADQLKAAIKLLKSQHNNPVVHTTHSPKKSKHTKIGVISDTHVGSKYYDPKALEIFVKRCHQEGVDFFVHAGDVLEGHYTNRQGHVFELDAIGVDAQLKRLDKTFPDFKKKPLYLITGNHDETFMKQSGINVGREIGELRDEFEFIGHREADIRLYSGAVLKLLHPGGGSSYALSYKPQKIIESLSGGEKPDILIIGHFHKYVKMFYRNVHCWLPGTFQSQSSFMRNLHLPAHKCGMILDITTGGGDVKEVSETLVPFYE